MTALVLAALVTFPDGLPSGGGAAAVSTRLAIYKADPQQPAFKKVGSGVVVRAGVEVDFGGVTYAITADEPVTLPTMTAGTDYRIIVKAGGDFEAIGYNVALPSNSAEIGGFHYLPGGYPAGFDQGGTTTPTINEYSIWDNNYRPVCSPLGMAKVGNSPNWLDIYFQGDSSNADGVSRNNDPILTGTNPPLKPAQYGGDGTTKLTTLNWWDANEHLAQFGKELPSYALLTLAAFGTNEQDGRGTHPVKTGLNTANMIAGMSSDHNFTGHNGHLQITGVLWHWTSDLTYFGGTPTANSHGWEAYDVTGGRGKLILPSSGGLTAVMHGAQNAYRLTTSPTGVAGVAGSRAAETIEKLFDNSANIGIRGACAHMWR